MHSSAQPHRQTRAIAARLQLAALQEGAWRDNRYFVGWRNAALNGVALRGDALPKLQVGGAL